MTLKQKEQPLKIVIEYDNKIFQPVLQEMLHPEHPRHLRCMQQGEIINHNLIKLLTLRCKAIF